MNRFALAVIAAFLPGFALADDRRVPALTGFAFGADVTTVGTEIIDGTASFGPDGADPATRDLVLIPGRISHVVHVLGDGDVSKPGKWTMTLTGDDGQVLGVLPFQLVSPTGHPKLAECANG